MLKQRPTVVIPESPECFIKNSSRYISGVETPIIIGCNYHTTWQKHKAMRFVLREVNGNKARLITRNTEKDFWTDLGSLIFITTSHNIQKGYRRLLKEGNKGIYEAQIIEYFYLSGDR